MTQAARSAPAAERKAYRPEADTYWSRKAAWRESSFGRVILEIRGDKAAMLGLAWIVLLVLLAIFCPVLPLKDPNKVNIADAFAPPSMQYPFGTDNLGRDILARVIFAARVSVLGSIAAVGVGTILGVPWGLAAGFFGGTTDSVMMRVVDFMLAIPTILMALLILAVLGPGAINAIIAIAVTRIPTMARLARSSTLVEQERDYVTASRAIGARSGHMLFRVILPNTLPPVFVQFTLSLAFAILLESGLSFLGLGTRPPTPAWGEMLATGRGFLYDAPWIALFPGLAITTYVLAVGYVSDGLRAGIGAKSVR
jgi:peptide/nickel transport system permease protein